ncbi:unnamed protein product [Paramecium sonneborni]|uniref:Uncharacterized protein n=1 Tax=Paramecium sonneborni TaxID=65129 RepID=A0A8S1Q8N7_9CILI|nr:unnamed protein product [Paramecium sonneborni]
METQSNRNYEKIYFYHLYLLMNNILDLKVKEQAYVGQIIIQVQMYKKEKNRHMKRRIKKYKGLFNQYYQLHSKLNITDINQKNQKGLDINQDYSIDNNQSF